MYHDKGDTLVPYVHSTRIKAAMDGASLTNYSYNVSEITDTDRWQHGYPDAITDLQIPEATWAADIVSRSAWTVPASATHTVIGYIVTKRYQCWLKANGTATYGRDAAATVTYGVTPNVYTVTPLTGAIDVTITQADAKTGSATNISTATDVTVS